MLKIFKLLNGFYWFSTTQISKCYRKLFFLKKRKTAGKCTHGKIILGMFLQKKLCRKMHTRDNMFLIFSFKKGDSCGKMHTRQNNYRHSSWKRRPLREKTDTAKMLLLIWCFFICFMFCLRERNFDFIYIFTSQK